MEFLSRSPRGRERPSLERRRVPCYTFWMRLRPESELPVDIAGSVSLRVADSIDMHNYLGQVGYTVYPQARGHHLAERACRLLFPLARRHNMRELYITCNPDNIPSRRTCERLGGELLGVVNLPSTHSLFERGERQKCRYLVKLES